MGHRHPANILHLDFSDFGDRLADSVRKKVGSWGFVIGQTFVTLFWIVANSMHGWSHWDSYPFILLNLCYSFQAGYTGPILLLASNRAAEHDRIRAEADHEMLTLLHQINVQQLEILRALHADYTPPPAQGS